MPRIDCPGFGAVWLTTLEMTRRTKLWEWSRLFSEYAVAQAVIQLLGVLAGLWLVNLLPVREYALYAFALSIFTFVTVFSDLGVSSALLYFRREVRIANTPFAPYVHAAFVLRRGLLAVGALAGLALLALMGRQRGFGVTQLLSIGAVLVVGAWFQVSASMGLMLLRLEGVYRDSYLAEAAGNALRLFGVALIWLLSTPIAWLAMLTGVAGSYGCGTLAGRRVRVIAEREPISGHRGGETSGRDIVRYILPTLPSAAYFSIQAPLTVWLSAYFAGTQSIAEVGALGRLGMIFGLVSGFMGTVLIPRFSVMTDPRHYLRRYLELWAVLAVFGAGVVLVAAAVPDWFLLLLGHSYRGLEEGVLIVASSSVFGTWGSYAVAINSARGWVRLQPAALALFVVIQVVLAAVLDLSSTRGVLHFGMWSAIAGLGVQVAINATGFLRPAWVIVRKSERTTRSHQ